MFIFIEIIIMIIIIYFLFIMYCDQKFFKNKYSLM